MGKKRAANFAKAGGPEPYSATWRFGGFELFEAQRQLMRQGEPRRVEDKPLSLLMYLLRRPNEVVTKTELAEGIWAGHPISDSTIAQAVARLRAVLGDDPAVQVVTVVGVGYRLVAQPDCGTKNQETALTAPASAPLLTAGAPLPGRSGWQLMASLGRSGAVWKARHLRSMETRVYKFANDAEGLDGLKREIVIHRLLHASLGADARFLPLTDWNLEQAPYYLELPFLAAGSLAAWLEQQGGATTVPLAARLEIIARIAEAIALAHSVGVLHKDIKPSNILVLETVDGLPTLCLADFGCGLVLHSERLAALSITRHARPEPGAGLSDDSGTMQYLAPELLTGKAPTQQSDIYSLGVLLFQLAAGDLHRPLLPGWQRAIDDALLRDDIAAAADQDPAQRLADANELARRLRTLPERHAQKAAEREATQRLMQAEAALLRNRQRRPWLLGLAAALLIGTSVSLGLYLETRHQRQQAEQALAESQAVVGFLNDDLLGAANPLRAGGGRLVTVASLLDTAAEGLSTRFASQPGVQQRLALTLARSYQNLGLHSEARALLKTQLATAKNADPQTLATLRFVLADIDTEVDEYQEAKTLLDELLRTPTVDEELLMQARLSRAWLDFELGRYPQSSAGFDAILKDINAQKPFDEDTARTAQWWMVDSLAELGQLERADQLLAEVLPYFKQLYGENNAHYLWARMSLGSLRLSQGRYDEAEQILNDVESRIQSQLGEGHNIGLFALYFRGVIRLHQGRSAEALPMLERAYQLRLQYNGPDHHSTRLAMHRLGEAHLKLGHVKQGSALLEQAYASSRQHLGPEHPYTLQLAATLTRARLLAGDAAAAIALAQQASRHCDAQLPPGHIYRGQLLLWYGAAQQQQGQLDAATQSFAAAAAVFRQNGGAARQSLEAAETMLRTVKAPSMDWLQRLNEIAV